MFYFIRKVFLEKVVNIQFPDSTFFEYVDSPRSIISFKMYESLYEWSSMKIVIVYQIDLRHPGLHIELSLDDTVSVTEVVSGQVFLIRFVPNLIVCKNIN